MNVKIYDEKTGWMIFPIFPGKEPEKDENIIELFNNHIDLYLEKKDKELMISCHVSIQGHEESNGYYIKSLGKYEDNSFTEFKKESNKALRTLGLQTNPSDVNNLMLYNIEKLDLDIYLHEDTEIVEQVLKSGEYLEYQGGNIDEITIFCKDIIKNIDNSKIAISSDKSKLGDINILSTKKHEEPLYPNERTRAILNKYKKEFIDKKKKEEENIAKSKINDGIILIKEGLTILRSSGYDPTKISEEVNRITEEISASNKIRFIEKYKDKTKDKDIVNVVKYDNKTKDVVLDKDIVNVANDDNKTKDVSLDKDKIDDKDLVDLVKKDKAIVDSKDKDNKIMKNVFKDDNKANVKDINKSTKDDNKTNVKDINKDVKDNDKDNLESENNKGKKRNTFFKKNSIIIIIIIIMIIIIALILYSTYGHSISLDNIFRNREIASSPLPLPP